MSHLFPPVLPQASGTLLCLSLSDPILLVVLRASHTRTLRSQSPPSRAPPATSGSTWPCAVSAHWARPLPDSVPSQTTHPPSQLPCPARSRTPNDLQSLAATNRIPNCFPSSLSRRSTRA